MGGNSGSFCPITWVSEHIDPDWLDVTCPLLFQSLLLQEAISGLGLCENFGLVLAG